MNKAPQAIEIAGELYLNPVGLCLWLFELDASDSSNPAQRLRIKLWQGKVRARITAMKMTTGRTPAINDVLAAVVDLDKLAVCVRTGGDVLAMILDGQVS